MASSISDTDPKARAVLVDGYRRMSPSAKLRRVGELQRMAEGLAAARIRAEHGPGLDDRELRLRLAALRLDRQTMIDAFGWDPEAEGR